MTTTQIIEVAVAAALIFGAVVIYRRRGAEGEAKTGSQTAVILLVIGAIVAVHGLGLMEYRPSASELGQ
jgi:hypothetical protein